MKSKFLSFLFSTILVVFFLDFAEAANKIPEIDPDLLQLLAILPIGSEVEVQPLRITVESEPLVKIEVIKVPALTVGEIAGIKERAAFNGGLFVYESQLLANSASKKIVLGFPVMAYAVEGGVTDPNNQVQDGSRQPETEVGVDDKGNMRLKPLLPTTYFIADEAKVSCVGKYLGDEYDGSERVMIRDVRSGEKITVCRRYARVLQMEGTGVLRNHGDGRRIVNYAGTLKFETLDRCRFGKGAGNQCLIPFHSVAADLRFYRVGDIIYIPAAVGLQLPDGSVHNGLFVVNDTGSAFRGIGSQRVDLFVGFQDDQHNVFSTAGFHHKKPLSAVKLQGNAKKQAMDFFKASFADLY